MKIERSKEWWLARARAEGETPLEELDNHYLLCKFAGAAVALGEKSKQYADLFYEVLKRMEKKKDENACYYKP